MNNLQFKVRVERKNTEAEGICSFELINVDGTQLPPFAAGSHIDVKTPEGLIRQYSLCNDPTESHRYLIAVLKDSASRGGSRSMHDAVQEGDILEISAPRNHFSLANDAQNSLLLAGGIGITPVLCMAERLSAVNSAFSMHYYARSPERTAFRARIAESPFADRVTFHYDNATGPKLTISELLASTNKEIHIYVCGPKGFMDVVLDTARTLGWDESRLHFEFFSAEPVRLDTDGSFTVKLASTGKLVTIPANIPVTRALTDAGVHIPVSCEQGVCGTCLTRVLEGVPDHRDLFLSPREQTKNDQFTPCCSRSKSAVLVLDL
jgi:vanillate O-demethylase ferredoxin subunit